MEGRRQYRIGFTLVELMTVVLIVGILAAVAVSMIQGRIEKAKWSEGCATAGTIRTGIRAYISENGLAAAQTDLVGAVAGNLDKLGFAANDLTGTYFNAANFTVASIDADGMAKITVTAPAGLSGNGVLDTDGTWIVQ